jgi:hypothetical protein
MTSVDRGNIAPRFHVGDWIITQNTEKYLLAILDPEMAQKI